MLAALGMETPTAPAVWWALASACRMAGDAVGAERALRHLVRIDAGRPQGWVALGEVMADAGRADEAEEAWRGALRVDPRHPVAAALADKLAGEGRGEEALILLAPAMAESPPAGALAARARVYRALGRLEETADDLRAAAALAPDEAQLQFELAVALARLNRGAETVTAGRRAVALGVRSPDLMQVIGHGERLSGDLDAAEATFRDGLRQWPEDEGLHRELAALRWSLTGDAAEATKEIDTALAWRPGEPGLLVLKARVLEYAGDLDAARATLAEAALDFGAPPLVLSAAARLAIAVDPDFAAGLAQRALARQPDDPFALAALAEAMLATGDTFAAREAVDRLLTLAPGDEHGQSIRQLVWRLNGDPRYAQACDYETMVSTEVIATPPGWDSLEAYLADLAVALRLLHGGKAHPVGQSLRGGTQTDKSLAESDDPAIRAFFQAIEAPVAAHVARLDALAGKAGPTPHRVVRSWSVRLASGGAHVDHLHKAWISSAFYVALPPDVEAGGRAGWLRLGKPGLVTAPPLEAERWIQPRPGMLALFPSSMWHGTEPFEDGAERLTIAFDVDPA
ncbi:MAG: putative O-linked N-acetylglucosamine transferase, family [Caulobacter sp.]|nr:putative O-linked N-acetylglucosamine transferase, family [Caulobacter sp.]